MDRPSRDASAEEIPRFLEEDFWEQLVLEDEETGKGQSDGLDDSDEGAKNE